ncbi:G0/G1 switch protein 2 [Kryptolebias marmoratus]|uniref:G0/G1 switch protein 2 n=1 Tax=Kryptolebias marmoratus TaxID=37003 RepID=UPI0018ACEEFB|nr:G0/G1 switch protein 2 [Kryptolebias marmoratus]
MSPLLWEDTWILLYLNSGICSCFSTCKRLVVPNTWRKSRFKKMEATRDIIPFAKEMLRQKPSWSMLKIYALGSTLAVLGMVGGVVETILLPFYDNDTTKEEQAKFFIEQKKQKKMAKPDCAFGCTEAEDMIGVVWCEVKAKHLETAVQRSTANRLHAS